ncbi:MAG TPA: hypothetical protein VFL42_13655 [Terriglobales bacterium]|nr:hypothetical protein [Terriglobales bacterium]
MDPAQLNGKSFAVVLGGDKEQGSTLRGTARWDGEALVIDCGREKPPFEVRAEWYERIQPVKGPVAKAILEGAEFWLRLQVPDE